MQKKSAFCFDLTRSFGLYFGNNYVKQIKILLFGRDSSFWMQPLRHSLFARVLARGSVKRTVFGSYSIETFKK